MTAARDGWITCDRCHGSGGPASRFDDELGRWEHYVCGSCGGAGGRREPVLPARVSRCTWPKLPDVAS